MLSDDNNMQVFVDISLIAKILAWLTLRVEWFLMPFVFDIDSCIFIIPWICEGYVQRNVNKVLNTVEEMALYSRSVPYTYFFYYLLFICNKNPNETSQSEHQSKHMCRYPGCIFKNGLFYCRWLFHFSEFLNNCFR